MISPKPEHLDAPVDKLSHYPQGGLWVLASEIKATTVAVEGRPRQASDD